METPGSQSISWEQKRAFALDIASGLEALHRCHVIHGDLKPENIILFREPSPTSGSLLVAKLNDFGSAIVEDTTPGKGVSRERRLYMGTPIYVPPIVRESSGRVPFHVMPFCDIFSLGLVLWCIYKGRVYYEGNWKASGQKDQDYLDHIGIPGIINHFQHFLNESEDAIPLEERRILRNAFMACVNRSFDDDDSIVLPIARERTLKTAFANISIVKRALQPETMGEHG